MSSATRSGEPSGSQTSLTFDFTVQSPFAADGDVVKLSGLGSYTGRARARSG